MARLNNCRFNPTLGGLTDWTYSSAVAGYNDPVTAGAVTATPYEYFAISANLADFEGGKGVCTITGGVPTFARTTVLFNSLGTTAKINFAAAPQVAIVVFKDDMLSFDEAQTFTAAQQAQARANLGAIGPILLNTLTASNSATLSDTTSFTSTYSMYELVFENVIPATNNVDLLIQVHAGGAFNATAYVSKTISPNGTAIVNTNKTDGIYVTDGGAECANVAPGLCGSIRVFTPSTSAVHPWVGSTCQNVGATTLIPVECVGAWNSSAVVDGFQFKASSGNITSGVIKVYGYP